MAMYWLIIDLLTAITTNLTLTTSSKYYSDCFPASSNMINYCFHFGGSIFYLPPRGPDVHVDVLFFTFLFPEIQIKAACNNSGTLSAAYPRNNPRYPPALPKIQYVQEYTS